MLKAPLDERDVNAIIIRIMDFCFHIMQIKTHFSLNYFYSFRYNKWNFMHYELFILIP